MLANQRKEVPLPIKKAVFAKSMNKCAFPNCHQQIIDEYGKVLGEICHIQGVNKNSARYNPELTAKQQISEENLILLCPNHHTIIDNNEGEFSVNVIKGWKTAHEKIYEKAIESLVKVEKVFDTTRDQQLINFDTLNKIKIHYKYKDEEMKDVKKEIREFGEKLKQITKDTRDMFLSIIYRYKDNNNISINELELSYDSNIEYVKKRLFILKEYNLIDIETEDDSQEPYVIIKNEVIIEEFKNLSINKIINLEEIIINLNFRELD